MSLIERVGGIEAARKIADCVPDDTATHIIDYADNGVIDYLKNDNGWLSHYSGGWNSIHSIISAHFNDDCLIKISDLRAAIAELGSQQSVIVKVGGIEAAKKIVEGAPAGEPLILVAVRAEVVRYYSSDLKLWDGKRWVPTTNTKQSLQERYELYWLNDLRFALADTEGRVMAIKVGSKVLVECDNPYEAVVEALDGDQASIRVTSECPAKGSGTLAPLSALLLIVDNQTFDAIDAGHRIDSPEPVTWDIQFGFQLKSAPTVGAMINIVPEAMPVENLDPIKEAFEKWLCENRGYTKDQLIKLWSSQHQRYLIPLLQDDWELWHACYCEVMALKNLGADNESN